jgi:hypothetical protein
MGTLAAILLSSLLAQGEPVGADEIRAIGAALEEFYSSIQSIEVTYTDISESDPLWKKATQTQDFPPSTIHWCLGNGKQRFSRRGAGFRSEWMSNGDRTYVTGFLDDDTIRGVSIEPAPPSRELLHDNYFAKLLGLLDDYRQEGLLAYWKNAASRSAISGTATREGVELSLGEFTNSDMPYTLFIVVSPEHNYRIRSWRIESRRITTVKGKPVPDFIRYEVDEFQLAPSEDGGPLIWIPVKGRRTCSIGTNTLKVESVRLNHSVSNDQFVWQPPPFGTRISEIETVGKPPKSYLMGGEAAEERRLAEITDAARKEVDRLMSEGVRFDASPQPASYVRYWVVAGVVLIVVALARIIRRHLAKWPPVA